jgi:hypothetical protein
VLGAAVGAVVIGAVAFGAVAFGAVAFGAVAFGAVAFGAVAAGAVAAGFSAGVDAARRGAGALARVETAGTALAAGCGELATLRGPAAAFSGTLDAGATRACDVALAGAAGRFVDDCRSRNTTMKTATSASASATTRPRWIQPRRFCRMASGSVKRDFRCSKGGIAPTLQATRRRC